MDEIDPRIPFCAHLRSFGVVAQPFGAKKTPELLVSEYFIDLEVGPIRQILLREREFAYSDHISREIKYVVPDSRKLHNNHVGALLEKLRKEGTADDLSVDCYRETNNWVISDRSGSYGSRAGKWNDKVGISGGYKKFSEALDRRLPSSSRWVEYEVVANYLLNSEIPSRRSQRHHNKSVESGRQSRESLAQAIASDRKALREIGIRSADILTGAQEARPSWVTGAEIEIPDGPIRWIARSRNRFSRSMYLKLFVPDTRMRPNFQWRKGRFIHSKVERWLPIFGPVRSVRWQIRKSSTDGGEFPAHSQIQIANSLMEETHVSAKLVPARFDVYLTAEAHRGHWLLWGQPSRMINLRTWEAYAAVAKALLAMPLPPR